MRGSKGSRRIKQETIDWFNWGLMLLLTVVIVAAMWLEGYERYREFPQTETTVLIDG